MEQLDIHPNFEDYKEQFEVCSLTRKYVKDDKIVAHFLTFIGKDTCCLLKALALHEKPISLSYATVKELLLNHVKCTGFECLEGAKFHMMIRQNIQKVREFTKQAARCTYHPYLQSPIIHFIFKNDCICPVVLFMILLLTLALSSPSF